MTLEEKFGIAGVIGLVCFIGAAIAGYVMNVIAIIHTVNDPINGMFILRCIGAIVAPLGALLGWF